uniref:Uncharacterized protein n=1 Tax=Eutreptiella gymnastica TaxID=73025 RepID=A0A7S4FHK1_9EUGL
MTSAVTTVFSDSRSVAAVVNIGVGPCLVAGNYAVAFKIMKGSSTTLSTFFDGFHFIIPLFIAGVLQSICVTAGFMLLLIPGIYLVVAYQFTCPLILDKGMDAWEAMETSRRLITKRWFSMLMLDMVSMGILLLGALCLGLGLFVALPLCVCIQAAAYEGIVGLSHATDEATALLTSAPPPPV